MTPQVSGAQMNIHPFLIIVSLVVLALAFGLMGALVATPVAAFVVSHIEGFRSRQPEHDAARMLDEEERKRGLETT